MFKILNDPKTWLYSLILFVVTVCAFDKIEKFANQEPPPVIEYPVYPIEPNPPVKLLTLEESLKEIQASELKEWLYYLASEELEGRMSGKKGHFTAAAFIEKKCQEYGLKTMRQKFNIKRMNPGPKNEHGEDWTENVYAYIEGTDPILKDEIVVVGGHLDHVGHGKSMTRDNILGIHPGADDNASGSVALLAIAKAYSKMPPPPRTIVFQWYSAEEMGLNGSRVYCNNPIFPLNNPSIKKHIFMCNMDMVGRLGGGMYSVGWVTGETSFDLKRYVQELNSRYPFNKNITSYGTGGSDHANFHNKGIPVAFLHTGLHPDYHTIKDTPDKINYQGLEKIAQYAMELTHKVCNNAVKLHVDHVKFIPMSTTHDHGHGLFHQH